MSVERAVGAIGAGMGGLGSAGGLGLMVFVWWAYDSGRRWAAALLAIALIGGAVVFLLHLVWVAVTEWRAATKAVRLAAIERECRDLNR